MGDLYRIVYYTMVKSRMELHRHVLTAYSLDEARTTAIDRCRRYGNAGPVSVWDGYKLVYSGQDVARMVAKLS